MSRDGSIGIDVGGSKTLFELLDPEFKPVELIKVKTPAKARPDFTEVFVDSLDILLRKAKKRRLGMKAVGIGCAGAIDTAKNVVKSSPNIPALDGYSFEEVVSKHTTAPVQLCNDIHAALYGELKHGAAVGYRHVIAIFLGTGVGAALAIDGKLYVGASGGAGNIGAFRIHPFGLVTGSERLGMLDNLVSRTSIAAEALGLAARHEAPHLLKLSGGNIEKIKSSTLAKAIRSGDKAVEELVRSRAQILGIALSNMMGFLNPQLLLLGGGLTEAMPELILEEVESGIKAPGPAEAMQALRIAPAKLKGDAVAIGAAQFALDAAVSFR